MVASGPGIDGGRSGDGVGDSGNAGASGSAAGGDTIGAGVTAASGAAATIFPLAPRMSKRILDRQVRMFRFSWWMQDAASATVSPSEERIFRCLFISFLP